MRKVSEMGLNEGDKSLLRIVLHWKDEMSEKNVDYVVQVLGRHDPETDAIIPYDNGKMYGEFRVISPYNNHISEFETVGELYAQFSMLYEQFLNGYRGNISRYQ